MFLAPVAFTIGANSAIKRSRAAFCIAVDGTFLAYDIPAYAIFAMYIVTRT
jgi:hypothetical protein